MVRIEEVIIVEGKYDKNTLRQVVDAVILETSGFGIFHDKEKRKLFQKLAGQRGLILLTDSDGAGFVIRNYLKGILPPDKLKQAYIPDLYGKEKRKTSPSKEGKLGVEGMRPEILLEALRRAGAHFIGEDENRAGSEEITKADLYRLGLSGGEGSRQKRLTLLKRLELPERLSSDAMLDVLNALMSREDFFNLCRETLPDREGPARPEEVRSGTDL